MIEMRKELRGVIRGDALYTADEFKARLGITSSTLRAARQRGLRVAYAHKRLFIYGQDWIDYILSQRTSAVEIATRSNG